MPFMAKILLLNGPNFNLLGKREPHLYGSLGLEDIQKNLIRLGSELGHRVDCFQSNAESELIDRIHQSLQQNVDCIIINAGAFTHTSIALRDALLGVSIPFIEVHQSNIYAREPFRHHSYLADKAIGVIAGFGLFSYELALQAAHHHLLKQKEK